MPSGGIDLGSNPSGAIKKMKRLFKFKYPKLTLLVIVFIAAYFIFRNADVSSFISNLQNLSYLGSFISGLLFSFGFTTPFAVGYFIISNPQNILYATLLGGFGAMLSDLFIFKIIKFSFLNEFMKLEKSHPVKKLNRIINRSIPHKIKAYLTYLFAGVIIASPLPDEFGVTMLAGLTHIKTLPFAILSFITNSIGIAIILCIGLLF